MKTLNLSQICHIWHAVWQKKVLNVGIESHVINQGFIIGRWTLPYFFYFHIQMIFVSTLSCIVICPLWDWRNRSNRWPQQQHCRVSPPKHWCKSLSSARWPNQSLWANGQLQQKDRMSALGRVRIICFKWANFTN